MSRFSLGLVLALALPALASAEPASPTEQARAQAEQARAASARGAHAAAAAQLAEAIALALPHDAALAGELKAALAAEKPYVITLVLTTDAPAGTAFLVDGARVGESPLRAPLYLAPGKHALTLLGPGLTPPVTQIDLAAGANVRLSLASSVEPDKPLWPALVLGGVSAAGLGVGIGLLVTSFSRESDADALAAEIPRCDLDRLSQPCQNLATLVSERNALRDGSSVGFVVAGVALAATLAYVLVPTPVESPVQAALGLGPGGASLALRFQ